MSHPAGINFCIAMVRLRESGMAAKKHTCEAKKKKKESFCYAAFTAVS